MTPNEPAYPDDVGHGLTKREYFAACAMQGIWANAKVFESTAASENNIADEAVRTADALIAALNRVRP